MKRLRPHIHDPGLFSLKRAARAAIVMPVVFAFADKAIQDSDTTLFAAFGSIALLVFTDFGGPWRRRLAAYLALALAGVGLISLGTLCSQTPWLAVAAMAVVGFAILFSGGISAYFAAAGRAALLLFVIPVAFPGPPSAIPARLEGWALAASAGICAVMLLWPSQPRDRLRAAAAGAARALADLLDSELSGNRSAIAAGTDTASAAVSDLRRSFVATPYRPSGPSGSTEALAFLVDAFEWLLSVVSATADSIESRSEPCREENREVMAAAVAVLRTSAANLDSERLQPDLDRLERAREAVVGSLVQKVTDLPGPQEGVGLPTLLEPTFRMRELSFAAWEIGGNSLLASGGVAPRSEGPAARARSALKATARLLLEHASPRSPLFRNSLRGAAGLSVAVLVIELASLQHAFWVALATLSVLRSSALGTGSTIVSALAGTTVGIVIGGLLVYAIGTDETVLWVALPPAVLLAAYAPRAISFAAGQAGFTIVVLIVFNLIVPGGWTIGLVRVEDVAIGCAISLVVGVLFWPRGAEKLLRESLGAAYARSADYVAAAAQRLAGGIRTPPTESAVASARAAARGAAHRLDDAHRQYLTEPGAQPASIDSVATLVAGATRVRLAAYSLSTLTPTPGDGPRLDTCADALAADVDAFHSWYLSLSAALVERTAISPTHPRNEPDGVEIVRCVSRAFAAGNEGITGPALSLLWANQHLDNLRQLGVHLTQPTAQLSRPAERRIEETEEEHR
jgi:uncharacterized membrane protein YccC